MWLNPKRVAEKLKSSEGKSSTLSWLLVVAVVVGCGRGLLTSASGGPSCGTSLDAGYSAAQ